MPMFNIFNTPYGCKELNVVGNIELFQTGAFAHGAIARQLYYDFDMASLLRKQSFFSTFNDIQSKNVTSKFMVENEYITPASSI